MVNIQEERPIELTSPLGDNVLLFRRMQATEQLGRPFEFELEILSEDHAIIIEDVLAQNLTVRLARGTELIQCPSCDRILYVNF